MNFSQYNIIKEWVTDVDPKYLSKAQAFYLQNREIINEVAEKNSSITANKKACELEKRIGDTYRVGSHYSILTNECYVWVYSTRNLNFIYRFTENDCQVVYEGCLNISANPKNDITQFRATLLFEKTCKNWAGKRLVWADGFGIYSLDVEASIATDSFTTEFFNYCNKNPCSYIDLCITTPYKCPVAQYLPTPVTDLGLNNKIVDVGFQFAYRFHYYDRRMSKISNPSTYYYQSSKKTCFEGTGLSRCMSVNLPIGNPMVEYVELLYRKDNSSNWYSASKIPKYKKYNSAQQQWYERQFSEEISNNLNLNTCTFDYIFCNNDFCQPVDVSEVISNYDRFPRMPQGLFPYGDNGLAVYNYVKGNCVIDKLEQEKFKVKLNCNNTKNCTVDYVDVTARVIIHNFFHSRNQFIWRFNGADAPNADDDTDVAFFGGLNKALAGGLESGYGQKFYEKKRNFNIYIDGTDYYGEMKQYKCDAFFRGVKEYWGVVGDMNSVSTRNAWRRSARNGEFLYSEYTFKVPKGTKGFIRLQSHKNTSNDHSTSSTVSGTWDLNVYKGDLSTSEGYSDGVKELWFDTCNVTDKLDLTTALVVEDTAIDDALSNKASAYSGYVKDCNGAPVEGAIVSIGGDPGIETDWNGFYYNWRTPSNNDDATIAVLVEKSANGAFQSVYSSSTSSIKGTTSEKNISIVDDVYCNSDFFAILKAKATDCNGNPLSGVRFSVSGSKGGVTNSMGETKIRLRNYQSRNRSIRVALMNPNECYTLDCNDVCNPCMDDFFSTTVSSYSGKPVINIGTSKINTKNLLLQNNGLKKGGRYQFGFQLQGSCGNFSFVYANKSNFIDIPKNNGSSFEYCNFEYDITGLNLPNWVQGINLVRTKNLNPFELQWIVDKVEYKDGKIRLTIQSLNNYNLNAAFKSNTVYQYLENDRLEIVSNDKGIYLGQSLNYKILSPFHDEVLSGKKEQPADYFNQLLIEDDGRIEIKKGFVIEMQRPSECAKEQEFYTICSNIPVVNGKPIIEKGIFNTFDTYYINRKFSDNNTRLIEHHSPSDYWGDKITDIGIVHIVNEFEDEKRYGRNITISTKDNISNFNYFEKTFDNSLQGDIVAIGITDDNTILGICEHDNFLVQKANDLLQVNANGNIQVITGDQTFSDPQSKLSGRYGCQYEQIGSVYFGDGYATWVDANNMAYVMHNYSVATDVSFQKTKKWFYDKLQKTLSWNKEQDNDLQKYRFSTGENSVNGVIMLTVKRLLDSGIDKAIEPNISLAETISFYPKDGRFLGNYRFLPEGYSKVNLFDEKGCKFLTFLNGEVYIHPVKSEKWNEFFGVATDTLVGVCLNENPTKIKRGLSFEIQSNKMWFLSKATTEIPEFETETPAAMIEKIEDKWNGAFLNNKNELGGIYGIGKNNESQNTRGYYIKCIFVRDNTLSLGYNTIDEQKQVQYDDLDMIIFKYLNSEQSGFSENL